MRYTRVWFVSQRTSPTSPSARADEIHGAGQTKTLRKGLISIILIIAEKPSVAKELARVVGAGKKENGYYSGSGYYVSWCIGHLVELADADAYGTELKTWSLDTLPIIPVKFKTEVSAMTARQFNILKALMTNSDVTELVEATDAGREGELIFRLVYEKAGCKKPFKRLWISSMEDKSIRDGLANMKPGREYDNLYQSALCRQRADWLVGINMTRLYTKMYGKLLKVGRVQTPTVHMIVSRQREIEAFIPLPYYNIVADLGGFSASTKVDNKRTANEIVSRCRGTDAYIAKIERQDKKDNPDALYDLTALQRDANRLLGYTAQQTLDYTQKLYEDKLVTYPRTDSRYITADMENSTFALVSALLMSSIVDEATTGQYDVSKVSLSRIINDKKVTDHHAIIPTINLMATAFDALPTGAKNLLYLIIYRLLSAVYVPHTFTATKAIIDIAGEAFTATGKEVLEPGYKFIVERLKAMIKNKPEPDDSPDAAEMELPPLTEGAIFPVVSVAAEEKHSKPPRPYTDDTLLSALETAGKSLEDEALKETLAGHGLGTPATRAGIIENIIRSGYVVRDKKNLLPTPTAITFIDIVASSLKNPQLTAEWEKQLEEIAQGQIAPNVFMDDITGFVRSFVTDTKLLCSPKDAAGMFDTSAAKTGIGTCPRCGKSVIEHQKAFSCESGKTGCGFVIWRQMCGKTITKAQAKKLLASGKTDVIAGFKSKAGKSFDAYIQLNDDNAPVFGFPAK